MSQADLDKSIVRVARRVYKDMMDMEEDSEVVQAIAACEDCGVPYNMFNPYMASDDSTICSICSLLDMVEIYERLYGDKIDKMPLS